MMSVPMPQRPLSAVSMPWNVNSRASRTSPMLRPTEALPPPPPLGPVGTDKLPPMLGSQP